MDIVREKPKSNSLYRWLIAIAAVGATLSALYVYGLSGPAGKTVDRELLRIATVQKGDFDIVVRAPGSLIPVDIRWLAAEVGGRVERVLLQPGAQVKTGDIIAVLSNPKLLQSLDDLQWDIEATEAQMRAELSTLESRVLDQQMAELNAKNLYESSSLTYAAQLKLKARSLSSISEIEFETIRMETEQRKQGWQIEQSRTANLQRNFQAQVEASKARLNKMIKQLARAKQQVAELTVRASIDSVVQDVAIELGQLIQAGGNIAVLVKQDSLLARIEVPEYQVHNVALGQEVIIDTRKTKNRGIVERVSPSVIEGTVEVDVRFVEGLPAEARPDLTVDAEIMVASMENTLYVERPAFSQINQQMRLFKLEDNGNRARKTLIEFGKGSASKIEIKSGINAGDRIIVSDQADFDKYSILALSN
ncbi:Multidrug efflux pump subunit AcrA (membrane-fusion protein) [Alteromonadaceae bacterium Bs31]|nr:Multidrug efflux pump subunit AcrA (membrane-fusion protein) [Alteromonadaceae bacterium Bs31]